MSKETLERPVECRTIATSKLVPVRVGAVLGIFSAFLHLIWVVVVASGVAEPAINFWMRLHFIEEQSAVARFDIFGAIALVALASAGAFIIGYVFALFWNAIGVKRG